MQNVATFRLCDFHWRRQQGFRNNSRKLLLLKNCSFFTQILFDVSLLFLSVYDGVSDCWKDYSASQLPFQLQQLAQPSCPTLCCFVASCDSCSLLDGRSLLCRDNQWDRRAVSQCADWTARRGAVGEGEGAGSDHANSRTLGRTANRVAARLPQTRRSCLARKKGKSQRIVACEQITCRCRCHVNISLSACFGL